MHSTSIWPSHSERCRSLSCMPWPPWPLQRLYGIFISVLHPILPNLPVLPVVGKQRRRLRQKRKASLVTNWFSDFIHARRSAGAHAGPRKR